MTFYENIFGIVAVSLIFGAIFYAVAYFHKNSAYENKISELITQNEILLNNYEQVKLENQKWQQLSEKLLRLKEMKDGAH